VNIKQKIACKCVTKEFADTQIPNKDDRNQLREMSQKLDSNLGSKKLINCNVLCLWKVWDNDETLAPESTHRGVSTDDATLSQGEDSTPGKTHPTSSQSLGFTRRSWGNHIQVNTSILFCR
jgi:hypothetical protein